MTGADWLLLSWVAMLAFVIFHLSRFATWRALRRPLSGYLISLMWLGAAVGSAYDQAPAWLTGGCGVACIGWLLWGFWPRVRKGSARP